MVFFLNNAVFIRKQKKKKCVVWWRAERRLVWTQRLNWTQYMIFMWIIDLCGGCVFFFSICLYFLFHSMSSLCAHRKLSQKIRLNCTWSKYIQQISPQTQTWQNHRRTIRFSCGCVWHTVYCVRIGIWSNNFLSFSSIKFDNWAYALLGCIVCVCIDLDVGFLVYCIIPPVYTSISLSPSLGYRLCWFFWNIFFCY